MNLYPWLKALHIAAAVTWIGGMLAASLTVTACLNRQPAENPALLARLRRWDRRVTSPAMLIVWAAGITLAIQGRWFGSPWLMIKLAIVLFLSALHGVLSGTLRRLEHDPSRPLPLMARNAAPATIICVFLIVGLAVIKPF